MFALLQHGIRAPLPFPQISSLQIFTLTDSVLLLRHSLPRPNSVSAHRIWNSGYSMQSRLEWNYQQIFREIGLHGTGRVRRYLQRARIWPGPEQRIRRRKVTGWVGNLFLVAHINYVLINKRYCPFLDAPSHLYRRVCPSVRRSVMPSLRRNAFSKTPVWAQPSPAPAETA